MERNLFFDILKGGAIFFVALGHSVQSLFPSFKTEPLFLMIIMFHMPLFMLISGFFFYPSVEKLPMKAFVIKKFNRLYLPSLFWGLFNVILIGENKILNSKTIDFIYFADLLFSGMWFLTVLFILSVIGAVIHRSNPNYRLLAWLIMYGAIYIVPCDVFMVNELKFLAPFFILGIVLRNLKWDIIPLWMGVLSLIVFFICGINYNYSDSYYEMAGSVFEKKFFILTIFRFICGISGSVVFIWLCRYVISIPKLKDWLVRIGMVTLPIYVLHQKFLLPLTVVHIERKSFFISVVVCILIIESSISFYRHITHTMLRQVMFGDSLIKK